jgi:hypothetical protein
MRSVRPALLGLLVAGALSAQQPSRPSTPRQPLPVMQTVTFDVAGALQQRWRLNLEPLVFGRFTVGLAASYTTHAPDNWTGQPVPVLEGTWVLPPCAYPGCLGPPIAANSPPYRAWSFELSGRWYPAVLSIGSARQAVGLYIGEFVGYHRREITWRPIYYVYPPLATDTVLPQPDTLPGPGPVPYPQPGPPWTQRLRGWEPGVEAGVRVVTARHVVIDVGGWFKLATLDDPLASVRPGHVDARLVVAVGAGW